MTKFLTVTNHITGEIIEIPKSITEEDLRDIFERIILNR